MLSTIATLNDLRRQVGLSTSDGEGEGEPSLINFAVSDGRSVVATRYVTSRRHEAASLYFATGTSFETGKGEQAGEYRMVSASLALVSAWSREVAEVSRDSKNATRGNGSSSSHRNRSRSKRRTGSRYLARLSSSSLPTSVSI